MMAKEEKNDALFRDARLNRVCVLEDLDFYWDERELKEMKVMWKRNASVERIAVHFERDPDEILLAIMHLAREDKITARKTGLKGEVK
jgi:hypothetical protein